MDWSSHSETFEIYFIFGAFVIDKAEGNRNQVLFVTLVQESSLSLFWMFLSLYTSINFLVIWIIVNYRVLTHSLIVLILFLIWHSLELIVLCRGVSYIIITQLALGIFYIWKLTFYPWGWGHITDWDLFIGWSTSLRVWLNLSDKSKLV